MTTLIVKKDGSKNNLKKKKKKGKRKKIKGKNQFIYNGKRIEKARKS